jgi:hypothetical protein
VFAAGIVRGVTPQQRTQPNPFLIAPAWPCPLPGLGRLRSIGFLPRPCVLPGGHWATAGTPARPPTRFSGFLFQAGFRPGVYALFRVAHWPVLVHAPDHGRRPAAGLQRPPPGVVPARRRPFGFPRAMGTSFAASAFSRPLSHGLPHGSGALCFRLPARLAACGDRPVLPLLSLYLPVARVAGLSGRRGRSSVRHAARFRAGPTGASVHDSWVAAAGRATPAAAARGRIRYGPTGRPRSVGRSHSRHGKAAGHTR